MASNKSFSSDQPTVFAHPGWRVAYTLVSWVVLGITISPGNSFFVGLMMLSWGLLFDYFKFTPTTKLRIYTRFIGCAFAALLLILNLIATFGALTVIQNQELNELHLKVVSFPFFVGEWVPIKWYWLLTGLCVLFTVVDWISEIREVELQDAKAINDLESQRKLTKVQTAASRSK